MTGVTVLVSGVGMACAVEGEREVSALLAAVAGGLRFSRMGMVQYISYGLRWVVRGTAGVGFWFSRLN